MPELPPMTTTVWPSNSGSRWVTAVVAVVMISPVRGAGARSRNAAVTTFQLNSLHLRGARHARPSQVEDHLAPRSGAANKRFSRCGRIQRLRVIFHGAGNQRRFTGVADAGST